jgi:hypothetical protein
VEKEGKRKSSRPTQGIGEFQPSSAAEMREEGTGYGSRVKTKAKLVQSANNQQANDSFIIHFYAMRIIKLL